MKILALIVIIAAAGAAGWFLGKPYFGGYARDKVVAEIEKELPAGVKIGTVDYKAPASVVMTDVKVDGGKKTGGEIFAAENITVSVSLISLFKGKVEPSSVTCTRPVLRVVRYGNGATNIDSIFEGKEKKNGALNLILVNPKLIFKDFHGQEGIYEFTAAKANFRTGGNGPLKVHISGAKYGKSRFDMSGTAGGDPGQPIRLKIKSDRFRTTDIAVLLNLTGKGAPALANFDAPLSLSVDVSGTRGNENIAATISASSGVIGGKKIESIRANGTWNREKLDLRNVIVRVRGGGEVSGSLLLKESEKESMLDMDIKSGKFPVEAVSGVWNGWSPGITGRMTGNARIRGDVKKKETLKGRVSARLEKGKIEKMVGEEPLFYSTIDLNSEVVDGKIHVKSFMMQSREIDMELAGFVGLDGGLDLNGRAEITKEKAKSAGVKKLVGALLPDGAKGYVLKVRIAGRVGEPRVEYSAAKTVYRGFEDKMRDTGNKVENFIKKVF